MNHNVVRGVLICFAVSSCKGCFDFGDSSNDDSGCESGDLGIEPYEAGSYEVDATNAPCNRCGPYLENATRTTGEFCADNGSLTSLNLYEALTSCVCNVQCISECDTSCGGFEDMSPTCKACMLSKCWPEYSACKDDGPPDLDASVPDDASLIDGAPDDATADDDGSVDAAVDAEQ